MDAHGCVFEKKLLQEGYTVEPRSKASFIMNNTTGPAVWIGDKRVHKLRHLVRADCFGIFRAALVSPTAQRQRTETGR